VKKSTNNIGVLQLCGWASRYAVHRRLPLVAVIAAMLVKVGIDVLRPWPMAFLIDYVLGGKAMPGRVAHFVALLPAHSTPTELIAWSVAATVLLFLLSWAATVVTAYANISLGQRMTYDLAAELFAKLQELSLKFHFNKSVGDSIRRVTSDCACVSTIVKDALLPVLSSVVTLIVTFAIMWRFDATLTLLALAVAPCMVVVFRIYARPMMERSYAQQEAEGKIYEVVEQTFSAMPVVQAFTREETNDERFHAITAQTMATTLAATRIQMQFKFLIGLATAVGTAGILWIGAQHALRGELTVGTIVAFLYYLAALYTPLEAIMYTTSTIQGASGSARRVMEILARVRDIADRPHAPPLSSVKGNVHFEDVTFGYEPDRPVLRNISLDAKPGERIAIVGATGAGKSTLVSLIPRFFDPWRGRVLIDGTDVRDVTLKSLRNQIAIVLQEPFLFPMTIAENIAYGNAHASIEEIVNAARAANAHDFVQRLPQKYDTVIGERGATLSGGERQRLSIARAFLKNAPILILDEPTSALDATTEHSLLEALERLTVNRTTFIIAHRLTTVRRATRIIALAEGSIVEAGTHEELLARKGVYAQFHDLQFGSFEMRASGT
jgi:ATP-binding cassette subfamily B protein/subfamily B ATP-binding cassette protein MsbA